MVSLYVKDRGFYKNIIMKRNNRKRYVHIDRETGSNEIFALLDKTESETESDIENLLKDSDTEYIAEELILDNKEESHQILTPERTVYAEGEVLDIDDPPAVKLKKKVAELKVKITSKFVKAKQCTLEASALLVIPENTNPLLIFEGTTNLIELVKHICDKTNLYATQNGREFENKSICYTRWERVCYKSIRNTRIFRYQLYHVDFEAAKREVLFEC